jgi:hypothetical protein
MSLPCILNGIQLDIYYPVHFDKILDLPPPPQIYFEEFESLNLSDKNKIGLVWQTNIDNPLSKQKSINVELFDIFKDLDFEFYCLQPQAETPDWINSLPIEDLHDTARFITQCDFIISVDTITLHLAGVLGKKTFLEIFGKIGIIAELTFEVIKSNKKIAILEILNFSDKKYFQNIETALGNNSIVGISGISKGGKYFGTSPNALMMILESNDLENDFYNLDSKFENNPIRLILKENKKEYFDFNFTYTEINKKQIFEYYPIDLNRNHLQGIHPWADFIFDFESYQTFLPILREVIQNYNLEKYILTQSFLNGKISINIMPTYIGKYLGNDFPLVPEVVKIKDAYSYGIGFMPTIPKQEVKKTLNAISDLTKLTYQLNGKRYLYGIHNLSQDNLEKQFGKETLETWVRLKKEVDPKNLLNSHVIFQ